VGRCGYFCQGLEDQRQVWIDFRGALRTIDSRQAGLGQHPGHSAVVHVQLPRDGASAPFFDVMKTQYLRLNSGAKTRSGQKGSRDIRTNDSARTS
jgi:hypothetical protein